MQACGILQNFFGGNRNFDNGLKTATMPGFRPREGNKHFKALFLENRGILPSCLPILCHDEDDVLGDCFNHI